MLIYSCTQAGFVDSKQPVAKVKPADYQEEAQRACELSLEDAKNTYPHVEADNLPFLCLDLTYQYSLLVDGFSMLLTFIYLTYPYGSFKC